jgi:hypothetical protein
MRAIAGSPYLSGSTTCHWYFNPNIPEAQNYYERFVLQIKFKQHFLNTANTSLPKLDLLSTMFYIDWEIKKSRYNNPQHMKIRWR